MRKNCNCLGPLSVRIKQAPQRVGCEEDFGEAIGKLNHRMHSMFPCEHASDEAMMGLLSSTIAFKKEVEPSALFHCGSR